MMISDMINGEEMVRSRNQILLDNLDNLRDETVLKSKPFRATYGSICHFEKGLDRCVFVCTFVSVWEPPFLVRIRAIQFV